MLAYKLRVLQLYKKVILANKFRNIGFSGEPFRQKVNRCSGKTAVLMGKMRFDQSHKEKLWYYRLTFVQKRTYWIAFLFNMI